MFKQNRNRTVAGSKQEGSTFDSFLEEEGILEEVEAVALDRVLAWQLSEATCKPKPVAKSPNNKMRPF